MLVLNSLDDKKSNNVVKKYLNNPICTYVFIGHGWNTTKTLSIKNTKKIEIVMLKESFHLLENPLNKHKQLLSKIGINGFTIKNYIQQLKEWGEEYNNIFCTYDSSKYPIVPDLLLTTYNKNSYECEGFLQKVGNVSNLKIDKVLMLSDIIKKLDKNFTLILYVCRSQLDEWQMRNIYMFVSGSYKIKKYIENNNIQTKETNVISPPSENHFTSLLEEQ